MTNEQAAHRGEHLVNHLRDWFADSRQREAWNDSDRGTYHFRAMVLEAALEAVAEVAALRAALADAERERDAFVRLLDADGNTVSAMVALQRLLAARRGKEAE